MPSTGLPVPVHTAVAALRSVAEGAVPPRVHVRTASGRWVCVFADRLDGAGGPQTAVMFEPLAAGELSFVFLRAHGLTPAQERVAALALRGLTTRQIATALFISTNTVQEHLTGVFDKVGIRSRRELAAALLAAARGSAD